MTSRSKPKRRVFKTTRNDQGEWSKMQQRWREEAKMSGKYRGLSDFKREELEEIAKRYGAKLPTTGGV